MVFQIFEHSEISVAASVFLGLYILSPNFRSLPFIRVHRSELGQLADC